MNEEIKFETNSKGGKMAFYLGESYNFGWPTKKGITWRCVYRPCKGNLITTDSCKFLSVCKHTHFEDNKTAINARIGKIIKDKAKNTRETTKNIIIDVLGNLTCEEIG